jgi:DNA-binding HxlR family transcriptional regulator
MKRNDRRSDCPTNFAIQSFGDSWSLLIVRDLMFKRKNTFTELLESEERISTNILSSRLKQLGENGIISKTHQGREVHYSLTKKGLDLAPLMVEMILWSAKYDPDTATPRDFIQASKADRKTLLNQIKADAGRAT